MPPQMQQMQQMRQMRQMPPGMQHVPPHTPPQVPPQMPHPSHLLPHGPPHGPQVPHGSQVPQALGVSEICCCGSSLTRRCIMADPVQTSPPRPIPVSERLPGPEDCQPWPGEPDATHWCWVFVKGPLGDDSWERRPATCLTAHRSIHTHWLPAHALPLPEVNDD